MDDRDNQISIPTLPLGARLVAAVYGFGSRAHLAVILTIIRHPEEESSDHDQFVVWLWNAQTEGVSGGNYWHRGQFSSGEDWVGRAWSDFVDRSATMLSSTSEVKR